MDGEAPRRDEVARWVRRLRLEPAQKLALMLVFDHAGPQEDGTWAAWPSMGALADEAGWSSPATVRKRIGELEALGHLRREGRERANGSTTSNRIVLLPVAEAASQSPATGAAGGPAVAGTPAGGVAPHKPQIEAPTGRERREHALAQGIQLGLTYRRKAVPEHLARRAVHALAAYCVKTDQRVQAWRPDGRPTEDLLRVLGAVIDHPEVDTPRWREVVDGVVENPWFDGEPSVGVVFGPRVVADNLRAPTRGASRQRHGRAPTVAEDKESKARRRMAGAGRR